MSTLPNSILKQVQSLPESSVLSSKEFLHLGSRPAVDQAFSRLDGAGDWQGSGAWLNRSLT